MAKLAYRTKQFLDAYRTAVTNSKGETDIPSVSMPSVDLRNAPWHDGYQNKSLQKSPDALINVDECKKGKILEGCSSVQYHIGNEVFTANDKRSVPAEYRENAQRIVSIDKMQAKFGDNWANVYYNLQDKAAIMAQPEDVTKKSFDRFVKEQTKLMVAEYGNDTPADAFRNQMASDFESGEYFNYAEDVMGYFPGGVVLDEKKKEHIAENRGVKKENSGLDTQAIAYAMGGSTNSPIANDAGIFTVTFPTEQSDTKQQSSVGKTLMQNISDMTDYAHEIMGIPEGDNEQKLFVSKDVVNKEAGTTSIAVLYSGMHSENEGEVDAAVKKAVKDCIPSNVSIDEHTYQPLQSQVDNAKEHYSLNTGTWMSDKSLKKPILDTSTEQTSSATLRTDLVQTSEMESPSSGMEL